MPLPIFRATEFPLLFADGRDLGAQNRGMIYRRLPDQWPIDAELLMNQNVAQAHNVLPRHKTVSGFDFGTQPGNRFSNGREPLAIA